MAKDFIVPIDLQYVNTAGIGLGGYIPVGDPIEGSLAFIRITNDSNTDVYISYDGQDDHEYVPAGDKIEEYFQINSTPNNQVAKLKKGTVISIRGNAGVGYVYIAGYYNE